MIDLLLIQQTLLQSQRIFTHKRYTIFSRPQIYKKSLSDNTNHPQQSTSSKLFDSYNLISHNHSKANSNGSPQVRHQIRWHRLRHQQHQQRRGRSPRGQDIYSLGPECTTTTAATTPIPRPRPLLRSVWLFAPKLVRFYLWPPVQCAGKLRPSERLNDWGRYLCCSITRV